MTQSILPTLFAQKFTWEDVALGLTLNQQQINEERAPKDELFDLMFKVGIAMLICVGVFGWDC